MYGLANSPKLPGKVAFKKCLIKIGFVYELSFNFL